MLFPRSCFGKPSRAGKNHPNLSTVINKRLANVNETVQTASEEGPKSSGKGNSSLQKQVAAKTAAFDFKGAIRLVSSNDKVLPPTEDVRKRLETKHPPPHPNTNIPPRELEVVDVLIVSVEDVKRAIGSFRNGSGGGHDGLVPQILKDATEERLGDSALKLLTAITNFINGIAIPGKIPDEICPVFFGASLLGLSKDDGGVRPIAVGLTWRRIIGKIMMFKNRPLCKELFYPIQLGVGVEKGAEICVHTI